MNHRHLDPGTFDALTSGLPAGWADDVRRALDTLSALAESDDDCPVCHATAALSEHGPEVLERVSAVTAGLAGTLRTLRAGAAPSETPGVPGDSGPETAGAGVPEEDRGTAPTRRRPAPTTVRIDVSD